jgi:VIT1/CCC1 family predicted Fe2+/Mn2+ transporter
VAISTELKRQLIEAQRNEITEYHVYRRLAGHTTHAGNRAVLQQIAEEEKNHYHFWEQYTGAQPKPKSHIITFYVLLARLLGLTFAIKLMERAEEKAQVSYEAVAKVLPEALRIAEEEDKHEHELLAILDEERLRYVGSIVLGLSDALVELTGALAGLTLALQDNRLIAMIGLITGLAAAMSMAASEYLSTKSEDGNVKSPGRAALYTGVAYLGTVMLLIAPFVLLATPVMALGISLTFAIGIIFCFTYYVSVAQDLEFRHRFLEMAGLTLGVALVSFGIGFVVRQVFGVEA